MVPLREMDSLEYIPILNGLHQVQRLRKGNSLSSYILCGGVDDFSLQKLMGYADL
jgi:hypothetical protein